MHTKRLCVPRFFRRFLFGIVCVHQLDGVSHKYKYARSFANVFTVMKNNGDRL